MLFFPHNIKFVLTKIDFYHYIIITMKAILREHAVIQAGLVLSRKQAREKTEYRYPLLNLKSINQDATLNHQTLDVFDATESLAENYITKPGDVIIRTSFPYTAILIDEKTSGMVISSNFVIFRCKSEKLLPAYLFWYLNTEEMKKDIFINSAGNMLAAIKPQYFNEMKLNLPDLSKQKLIADFNLSARKELNLLERLKKEKEQYYKLCLEKYTETGVEK